MIRMFQSVIPNYTWTLECMDPNNCRVAVEVYRSLTLRVTMKSTIKDVICKNCSAVDPGAVETNIMREIPACITRMAYFALKLLGILQSPENGVSSILDAALAPPEITGVYFFGGNGRAIKSSALSYNSKLSKDLWATSCDIFLELQLASGSTSA